MPLDCTSPTNEPSAAPLDAALRTAHELRTLVQSLRLVAEELAATPLTAEQQRLHAVLRATIRDAESLITSEGLGPVAGAESVGAESGDGRASGVSATDVVQEVLAVAEVRARHKGIALHMELPAASVYLTPDLASVLRLCARNLTSNAITHTDEGSVTVALTDGAPLELSVTDTGSGIASQDLPYVFCKGFAKEFRNGPRAGARADGVDGQTVGGFGLAIVKEAVESVGGEVALVETSAQGTRFMVRLPRIEPNRKSCAPDRGKVLIADDSESIRELLAMIVTAGGYEVVVAADGAEAVALAARTVCAAVILDQDMPGLNGAEAAARIIADADRRGAPCPGLIALSGETEAGNSGEGGLWQERWHKPIGRDAILAGLARVLSGASE